MKITIITLGGITNFGERAILMGTILDLKNKYPNSDISIYGYENLEKHDLHLHNLFSKNSVKVYPTVVTGKSKIMKSLKILGIFLFPSMVLGKDGYNLFKKSDLIVSKGQESLSSAYGFVHFVDSFLDFYLISRINKNIILYGQSIGPLHNKLQRLIAKFVLRNIKNAYVRDSISENLLIELGYPKKNIFRVKDLAYKAIDYFKGYINDKKNNEVIIIPNRAILTDIDKKTVYIKNLLKISEKLIEKKINVVFTSTVTASDWNNDFEICNEIKKINNEVEIRHYETLEKVVMDLNSCNFLISSRLHPLIFATGLQKRVIALSDAKKIIGLLGDLELKESIFNPFVELSNSDVDRICSM